MSRGFHTTAIAQVQLADEDVERMRTDDDLTRVAIYAGPYEVVLQRQTLERALALLNLQSAAELKVNDHDPS